MKEQILKLIELKFELMELEKQDKLERKKIYNMGSYAYAEGYISDIMTRIMELESEINNIKFN